MKPPNRTLSHAIAVMLLLLMAILAGGAALRESATVDEEAHIGAGVSYLQKLDMRLNEEHPPLPKILAALPLVLRGVRADYSHISWNFSREFFPAYIGQWVFGEWLLTKWNDPVATLAWARAPMLLLAMVLGWVIYAYAARLGGKSAGLLCLAAYATTPAFIAFGPLVHTDIAVTLFSVVTLWRFAEVWKEPHRKNVWLFAAALAAALLSKFTANILFFAFIAFALSTRWRGVPGLPEEKPERRAWRRARWWATLKGVFWAAAFVYVFYFILSVHQSTDALDRLGHGAWIIPLRRLLLPAWLYLRGILLVLITGSRPTYILGHSYPHGVWFYFPVVFALKSSLGFLGLLVTAFVLGIASRKKPAEDGSPTLVPDEFRIHWRVLWVSLLVFLAFCLLSRLDISIRHFSVPLVLLTLLLALIPRSIERLRDSAPLMARLVTALSALLVISCLYTAVRSYPFYFPYINPLGFGRPGYALVNDSNLDWNQSLPEVRRFAEQHGLQRIPLDEYGFTDATITVPQSVFWNCQMPSAADAGQWVALSANMIMDGHNCGWLLQYPRQPLAGGAMYAVNLPAQIPQAGSPGGPPLPADYRQFGGALFDMQSFFLGLIHDPERLPAAWEEMMARFKSQSNSQQK
jgi:4-amino-4-deoxy-L-arabinose transferase-like glycosyltransferase